MIQNTLISYYDKIHFKVMLTKAPRRNLDEPIVADVGMSPWVYNLYMDPKEQASSGHSRFEWGLPQVMQLVGRHVATFQKYPRKDIGLMAVRVLDMLYPDWMDTVDCSSMRSSLLKRRKVTTVSICS